jgi:hypothetical protein
MKMMKSLILGSAAGLLAVGGAQAADLPLKAKAVEYVRICSLYGAGFYYIPGTDTCIKLGGYLRAEVAAGTNSVYTGNYSSVAGAKNRLSNGYTWRSREDLNIDTRTATEYGVVRTYFDATFTWTSGGYSGLGATAYDSAPAGTNGNGSVAGGSLGVYYAFIQFAGFTMGKAVSQFSAPWANYPGNTFDGLVGGGGTITGVNQFTYTAEFGNGVSASISAQDPTQYYQAGVRNIPGIGGGFGASDYAGTVAPDIVGQLRVDQAWGLFQASFAAHDNNAAYYGVNGLGADPFAGPGDKWGWAGQLALSIKNIPTGPGDTINVQGVYTNGATRYNIQDLAGQAGAYTIYGNSSAPGVLGSIGTGMAPDSVFIPGSSQELVTTWGMRGAFTHNWNPNWNTAIYGAYAAVSFTGTAKNYICGGVAGCNPDYNVGQIGLITRWSPVKKLTFSADAVYTMFDQKNSGNFLAGGAAVGKPAGLYEAKDQSTWQVLLRAQRNW